jgi:methylmalonyl-CoA/ethylmalonyl-CoA epimerase
MPQVKKIDHIGIVVANMKSAIQKYENLLLQKISSMEYSERSRVDLAFFEVAGVSVELVAPRDPQSEAGKFLRERGEGMHHICYQVDDLDGMLKSLQAQGFKLVDEKPRPGSRGSRIAFVDASSTGGTLTEYCQFPKG